MPIFPNVNAQNPFVGIQSCVADPQVRTAHIGDAMARDCMKAKDYDIQVQNEVVTLAR